MNTTTIRTYQGTELVGVTRQDAERIVVDLQAWLEETMEWHPYSLRTSTMSIGGVECVGEDCTVRSTRPGLDGWLWRTLPRLRRPSGPRSKRTESLCHLCAVKAGVTHD